MIKVENLVKEYGKIKAVDDVSFSVEEGEIFGLLGPNGAGKTTIIRILTTILLPTKGKARICGFDVVKDADKVRNMIGVAPQEINLDRELTVYENLMIHGMLHRMKDLKKRADELIRWAGLEGREDTIVEELSGGMKRRLLIARAIMHYPKVLFLDEPTVGLDPQIRRQIWDMIKNLKDEGITIMLTTHYIEEAETLCDRVGILNRGKLIAIGKPEELKERIGRFVVELLNKGKTEYRFFPDRRSASRFVEGLNQDAVIRKVNLEDVFIKITGEKIEE